MNDFTFYFDLGWNHIISVNAIDHLLFIIALASIYTLTDWKQILVLVTAFTIGHSVTLVLSAFEIISFNSKWVEFLIPLTIVLTAVWNIFGRHNKAGFFRGNYLLALGFGLIHGMGFANTIRFMLASAQEIIVPLLAFNLGIEAGQIAVVAIITLLAYIAVKKLKLNKRWWVVGLSAVAGIYAIKMCYTRWPV
jgi:hypothetical protein